MPSIVEAFMTLRVDRSKVKDDVEAGLKSADTSGAGKRAGAQYGDEFSKAAGGRQRDGLGKFVASHKVAGAAAGKTFGDEFSIQFTGTIKKTLAAIGPGILGMGLKGAGLLTGGGLAAGLLPGVAAGAGAGGIAAAGAGAIGIGAKTLIGSKEAQGPLYAQAQQVAAAFTKAMQAAAAPMLKPLQDAFTQIPRMLTAITPALQSAFAGAATLIQPLLAGVQNLATTVLPLLGAAFRAVAPLLQPMINGLTQLIAGIMPGLITLLRAAAPAVQALAGFLGTLGQGLGAMFAAFAPALAASSSLISSLGSVLATLLPVLAQIAGAFAQALAPAFAAFATVLRALAPFLVMLGQLFADIAKAMLGDLTWALQGVATLFVAIRPALEAFMRALSGIFTVLENTGVFQVLGGAIVALAKPLGDMITALVNGLVPILPPIIGFIGQLAALFAAQLAAAIAAILPPLTQLATAVLQAIATILPVVLPLLLSFAGMFTGALVTIVAGLATALTAVLNAIPPAVLNGIVIAILAIVGAMKAWAVIQGVLNVLLAANPIGLVVIAIAALVAGLVMAWQHSAAFRDIVIAAWNALRTATETVFNAIRAVITAVWGFIGGYLTAQLNLIRATFTAVIGGIAVFLTASWNAMRAVITAVWNAIAGFFTATWNLIRGTFSAALSFLAALLTLNWTAMGNALRATWNTISAYFTSIWNIIRTTFTTIGNAIAAYLTATWNAIRATVTAVFNAIGAFFTAWWNTTRANAIAVANAIAAGLATVWNGISGTARAVWNGIAGFFTGWWTSLKNNAISTANGIATALAGVWNNIKATAASVWGAIKGAIDTAWKGIKDVIRAPLVAAAAVWNLFARGVNAVAGLFKVTLVPEIKGFAQGGKIPGYGGGDILPFAVRGGGMAMLEPGETIVSKETSRQPGMRAAFAAHGVPGYQGGGIIGFFGNVVKDAVTALIPGGKATVDMAKKIAEVTLNTAGIGTGYWPDLIKKIIDSLGSGVKKTMEAGAAAVLASVGGGNSISDYAESFLGKIPYVWGGASPLGADCSGFVQFVYSRFGIDAPRTSEAQGAWVKRADPSAGGLAFYDSPAGGPPPGHVAIIKNAGTVISQGGGMGPNLMGIRAMPLMWTGVPPGGFGTAGAGQVVGASAGSAQAYARSRMADYGWSGADMASLVLLWDGESGWRWNASNPKSGAYGIPQALPGSKMASAGADWRTNPTTQVMWGLGYIDQVYGSPSAAYYAWMQRNPHWYRGGGRVGAFRNGGTIPEPMLGIGASGTRYTFERGEEVQSASAAAKTADRLDVVVTQLDRLIATTAAVPAGVGRHVGGALGGASADAAFRTRYPRGGY
jgi:cell wall-associated NlpC family hydrolase/phage-related protein